jgi:hypothetical protein
MKRLTGIQRIENPSIKGFRENFFEREPVVICGAIDEWPALKLWTPQWLKAKFGETPFPMRLSDDEFVEFFHNAEKGRHPLGRNWRIIELQNFKFALVPVREYVDLVVSPPADRVVPYFGNVPFEHPLALESEIFQSLRKDFALPNYFPQSESESVRFWFSAPKQRSTIHNDNYDNLNAQVYGKKRFLLFSPEQHRYLYAQKLNPACWISPIQPDEPELDAFPEFRNAEALEVALEPGEILYIPKFWWHMATSLDVCINVNRWAGGSTQDLWETKQTAFLEQ